MAKKFLPGIYEQSRETQTKQAVQEIPLARKLAQQARETGTAKATDLLKELEQAGKLTASDRAEVNEHQQRKQKQEAQKNPMRQQDVLDAFNAVLNPKFKSEEIAQGAELALAKRNEEASRKEYESYLGSAENREALREAQKQANQLAFSGAGSIDPSLSMFQTGDAKQQELKAKADHYEYQRQAMEDNALMEQDTRTVQGWSQEDRKLLETYILGRNEWLDHKVVAASTAARSELYEKYGKETVENLAESWQRYQNALTAQKSREQTQAEAGSGFWAGAGHSAVSVAANALGSLTAPLGYLQEAMGRTGRYQTLDPNNAGALPGQYASAAREQVSKNIEGEGGLMGKVGSTVYQAGMSAADNLVRIAMGGGTKVGSLGLAAVGAFGSTLSEASSRGATPEQAVLLGVANAGIEAITEKLSIDKLFSAGKSGAQGAKQVIRNALEQAGVEAVEEEISFLGSLTAEAAILREKSAYNQQVGELVANGMSYQEAKAQADMSVWNEAVQTFATSYLSGGMMSGAQSAGQYVAQRMAERNATASKMEIVGAENATTADKTESVVKAPEQELMDVLTRGIEIPKTEAQPLSAEQVRVRDAIREVMSEMFPSDLDKAVKEYQTKRNVSDSVAESILQKNGFVQQLQQKAGLTLEGTKAEQVQAVKNAIAKLANKQTVAIAADNTGFGSDVLAEKAPGEWDPFADHRLLNEDGTPFEAMGAASIGHSHSAAYNQLLSDDNVQAPRKDDVRFVEVPRKDAQGRNVTEFVGNSVGSDAVPESFIPTIERLVLSGQLSHDTRHTPEGLVKASNRIQAQGIEATMIDLSREAAAGKTSPDMEDAAFLLFSYYSELPGENAEKTAAELYTILATFAHNAGGSLVEIRNLFRRMTARAQLESWKKEAAKLAEQAEMKPDSVTVSNESQQEFLDVANAEEMATTDAAKTLNRSAKQDAEAAAQKAAKRLVERAGMTPEQIGNIAGERAAKSATTAPTRIPTEDDLYSAIMTFIRSKKNSVTSKRRRNNALASLQRYYQDKDAFEVAWQQARRRAEIELGDDERGFQILQQFLDTGGMAQDVMDAYDKRSVSRRAMKEAATATETNFNQLIASSIQDKQAALAKIQTYISEHYGVSGKETAEMAKQIQESFFQELSERQSRRLRSLFAERGQTTIADNNGILPTKFRELYNLGAFDGDGFISRAALKRLFGADGLVLSQEVLDEYGATSELRKAAVEQKIVQEIADQLPTTLWDALNQWRYTAMLANPSTHGKNIIGTFGMCLIQHGLRDNLAAAMEIGTYYASGKRTARTKSFLNALSKKDRTLAVTAWNDYQNDVVSEAIKNGGRYGNAKARVEDAKRAWKFSNAKDNKLLSAINTVLGVAESATNLNSKLMDAEDAIFGRTSYSLALAGYMKANRLDHITPEARDYAIKQAQTATFHDDSFLYQKVKGVSSSKLGSVVAPFLKAPANVTSRVVEYSPGSLFTACYDFVRAAQKGDKTSADVISDLSTSIVGSALWGFGYWLAKEGLLRIGGSGSDEEKEYEERMGFEPWTMLLDGEYVDMRALSPGCVPIMTGAAIYEAVQNFDDGITFQEAMEALYYIADPILSTSPASNLDGFMYAIRGMDTMTTGELAGTIAAEMVESYVGQFIPALLRRVVNAQDNTQRKSVSTGDPLQDFTQYMRSGLPGEREKMYTEYDPWGRPLMQDTTSADGLESWISGVIGADAMGKINEQLGSDWLGTAARTLNVFSVSDIHTTDIDTEIERLLSQGYSVYPTEARKYITIPGLDAEGNSKSEKVSLTTEQWDTYNLIRGDMSYQLAKQLMANPVYAAMGGEEKEALLQAAYDYADEMGKQAALPERYTADLGEHLEDIEGIQNIGTAILNHEVSENISDAIDGLATLWNAGRDTSGAIAALEDVESVFDTLSKSARKALTESATGRLKAFLNAKAAGISAATFSQAFTKYYELGKQYENESEAATLWESSLQEMVNGRILTSNQADTLKNTLKYWQQIPADSFGKHSEYLAAGFSTDDALELTYAIDALTEEPGYVDVRPIQKMEAIAEADFLTEAERIKGMQMHMEDGTIQKMNSIMDEFDLTAAEFAAIHRAHLPQDKKAEEIAAYRALGYSQAEAERIYRIYNPTKK